MMGAPHASPCPERRHRFDCSKRWHGRTRSLRICGRESLKSKGGLCFWGTQKMATKPRLQHLQASVHHSKLQLGARTTVIVSSGSIQSFYLVIFDVLPLCKIDRLVRAPKKKYAVCYKSNAGCPSHDAMARTFAGRKSATARKKKKTKHSDLILRKVYIENAGTTLDSTLRKIHFPKLIVKTYSSKSSGTISFRSSPQNL